MDLAARVNEQIMARKGVLKVMDITDEMFSDIWSLEGSVKTQSQHDYENLGFEVLSKKRHKVCLFIDNTFETKERSTIKMICDDGIILGTSVAECEMESYRCRSDIIWISEDFVMFTDIAGKGRERFVLYPMELPELSDEIPGGTGFAGTFPTLSVDVYLKDKAGFPLTDKVFTFVMGYDEAT